MIAGAEENQPHFNKGILFQEWNFLLFYSKEI